MAGARKVSTLLFKSPAVTMPWRTSASIVVLAPSSACPPNVYSVPSSSEEEGVESDYKVCLVKRNVSFCLENCTTVLCTLSQRAADRSLVYLCVLNYARPTYPHTHSHAHAHTRARALLLLFFCVCWWFTYRHDRHRLQMPWCSRAVPSTVPITLQHSASSRTQQHAPPRAPRKSWRRQHSR